MLLSLLRGSAHLLTDVLDAATCSTQAMTEHNLIEAVRVLSEMNIHSISPLQASQILKQRIYATN